jgi:hypothetical protein
MTTPTTPATTGRPEITTAMTGRELRAWIGAVLPHAATDDTLPVLTKVVVEAADGVLYALATDRYTLAVSRHWPPDPVSGALTVTVAARALHTLLRQIKPRDSVRLTLNETGLTLDHLDRHGDPCLSYRLPNAGEPLRDLADWRTWLTKRVAQAPGPILTDPRGVGLNPAYLARFKTASDGDPLEMRPAGSVMVVTCGVHFLGLIAAMDLTGDRETSADPLTDWLPDLTADRAAA